MRKEEAELEAWSGRFRCKSYLLIQHIKRKASTPHAHCTRALYFLHVCLQSLAQPMRRAPNGQPFFLVFFVDPTQALLDVPFPSSLPYPRTHNPSSRHSPPTHTRTQQGPITRHTPALASPLFPPTGARLASPRHTSSQEAAMGQNLLASITHVNVGDVVVILVLLVFFWLDYAQVRRRDEGGWC